MISTHKVEVVPVELTPHENATNLSVVNVYGFTVVVRTQDWVGVDRGCFVPPDSLVKVSRPEFSFLDSGKGRDKELVRIKKLRGVVSFGLLIPCPILGNEEKPFEIGDDLAEYFEVEHYEPVADDPLTLGGDCVAAPQLYCPKYDIDSVRRYLRIMEEMGQRVNISLSEKIHGSNSRYVFHNGQMYCGSRSQWKLESDSDMWWEVYRRTPGIKAFCEANPDHILFGEVYGKVKGFPYDTAGKASFRAFDIRKDATFLDTQVFLDTCAKFDVPTVPLIKHNCKFDWEECQQLAEGNSLIGSHVREGAVIRCMIEQIHPRFGRVILKLVGNGYYEKETKS